MGAVIVSDIGKGSGRMGYVTMGGVMVTRLLGQQGGSGRMVVRDACCN